MKKEKLQFKVGDVISTEGHSNMIGKAIIRKIKGYSLYFTDSKGTDYSGIAQSQVRILIREGAWKLNY